MVDGLSGRDIAKRLWLSRHTMRHTSKHVHPKLDVDSRVAQTRLLLGLRDPDRHADRSELL